MKRRNICRTIRRTVAVLLLAASLIGVWNWREQRIGATPLRDDKSAYRTTYSTISVFSGNKTERLQAVSLTADAVYYAVTQSTEEQPAVALCRAAVNGDDAVVLDTLSPSADQTVAVRELTADADGRLWLIVTETIWTDDEENSDTRWYLAKWDGSLVTETALTGMTGVTALEAQNGQVYICAVNEKDKKILVYDEDTGRVSEMPQETGGDAFFGLMSDGRPMYVTAERNKAAVVTPLNMAPAAAQEPLPLADKHTFTRVYDGSGDYLFYAQEKGTLYGYHAEKQALQPLTVLADWGVYTPERASDGILDGCVAADGSLTLLARWETAALTVCRLTPCTQAETPQPLTVAGYNIGEDLLDLARTFNRTHPDYVIRFKDYADGGAGLNGITKFSTELLAGELPDIVATFNFPAFKALAEKEVLVDLYPYLDADADLSRDSFAEGLLAALEQNGEIYRLPTEFRLLTYQANRQVIGEKGYLTAAELTERLQDQSQTRVFSDTMLQERLINDLAQLAPTAYVDWDSGECRFDSPSFIALLEAANTLPDMDEILDPNRPFDPDAPPSQQQLADGTLLLDEGFVSNAYTVRRYSAALGDDLVYSGLPTEDGCAPQMDIVSGYAVTKACAHKDAAWAFVRMTLLPMAQDPSSPYGYFPANREMLDAQFAYFMDESNFLDEEGNRLPDKNGEPVYLLTQQDVERFRQALRDAAAGYAEYDQQIADIIETESSYYFEGACTAREAAEKIQSRVKLYVNEQR